MTETQLQEMLDEFALCKLVHSYCRAVDRGDFATLRELYHHDAVDAHGEISTGSVDEFLKTLEASRPHIRSMQHNVTTVNFVVDGYRAEGEVYTIATHTFGAGDRDVDVIIGGRYLDKYEKRNEIWKIIERTIVTRLGTRERSIVSRPQSSDHQGHTQRQPRFRRPVTPVLFAVYSVIRQTAVPSATHGTRSAVTPSNTIAATRSLCCSAPPSNTAFAAARL